MAKKRNFGKTSVTKAKENSAKAKAASMAANKQSRQREDFSQAAPRIVREATKD